MKNFFRKLGAFLTGVRVWTVNIFVLLLLVYFVSAFVMLINKMPGSVDPEGKVLILEVDGLVLDQEVFSDDYSFLLSEGEPEQIQTRDLVRLIRAAAKDDSLAGVVLDFGKARFAGVGTALVVAEELAALRESGKPVVAYSEALGTASYLMAAQADEVFLHPSGALAISGLGGYRDYTRELTDKLKINIHNYSQGDYKSAVEGFTRSDMSEPDREQRREIYAPMWDAMKNGMAKARGVDAELFQRMADEHPGMLFREASYDGLAAAEEMGLIDGTKSFPEFRNYMIERFGKDEESEKLTYPHITSGAYMAQLEPEVETAEDAVAVVFVQGAIQPGPQGPGVAGSTDIAGLLRKAHEKDSTRALVLRVNSPGGSIIASDMIRDEFAAARDKGIPIVVSMGDVAASGGVWVSTPADQIYAEPTTITGSIGVAVVFPTLENVFDYIGVNFDGVTTSKYAGWGVNLPVDEQLDAIFGRWAGSAYTRFIDNVATDREKDKDYIRSIAGGRVWIAGAAQERGLVDEIGNMEDAVAAAAALAGVSEYKVDYVVKELSPGMALLRRFGVQFPGSMTGGYGAFADEVAALFRDLQTLSEPKATVICEDCMIELR